MGTLKSQISYESPRVLKPRRDLSSHEFQCYALGSNVWLLRSSSLSFATQLYLTLQKYVNSLHVEPASVYTLHILQTINTLQRFTWPTIVNKRIYTVLISFQQTICHVYRHLKPFAPKILRRSRTSSLNIYNSQSKSLNLGTLYCIFRQ